MLSVFDKAKKPKGVQDAVRDLPSPEGEVLAYVTWRAGKERFRKGLPAGKHLVGNSPFSAIQVGQGGQDIAGVLEISPKEATFRCIGPSPVLFVDGRKMQVGDATMIGDMIEVTAGRTTLTISRAALAQIREEMEHAQAERDEEDGIEGSDQASSQIVRVPGEGKVHGIDDLRRIMARKLLDQLNFQNIDLKNLESPEVREAARLKLRKLINGVRFPTNYSVVPEVLEQQIFDEVMGLGPLESLLGDVKVSEIMVNRRDQIFIERAGKLQLSEVSFSSDQALLNVIERIVSTVGRRIDASSPIVDARLLDGSRVNAVIPPLALKGPCLTIRRFSKTPISVDQLVGWESLTQPMANFLKFAVEERKNCMISGGTGSGKTTLLNALSSFIPGGERIVTVEDAAELQLQQPHVISLETRPPNLEGVGAVTIRDLVKNTLRMRPDRIIVGECRGGEALDMLQAMNTGHDGSMTTAHANTPEDMLRRVETMVMMAGMELPLKAIREQIASALTIVVQQARRKNGRRLVTEIAWIVGVDRATGEYIVKPLFSRDRADKVVVFWDHLEALWEAEELSETPKKVVGPVAKNSN